MANEGFRSRKGPSSPPYTNNPYYSDLDVTHYGRPPFNPNRVTLIENFKRLPSINASIGISVNTDFEVVGTNASADDVTFAGSLGAIQLQTDGADNDQVIIAPHLDTGQSAWTGIKWGTENQVIYESVIFTGAIATLTIWLGLKSTNTSVIVTNNDQVWFRYAASSDTNWQCLYSIGGVDTAIDSGVAVVANTEVYFRIEIDSDRIAHFFINDKEVGVSTALTNDADLIPYIGVQANTGAARAINVVKTAISRIIYE